MAAGTTSTATASVLSNLSFPFSLRSFTSSSSAAAAAAVLLFPSSCTHFSSLSISLSRTPSPSFFNNPRRNLESFAIAEEEVETVSAVAEEEAETGVGGSPCELYVCNLPRSCDISQLLETFKQHGTVIAVEVSRDAETGISRGCGYVTMSSLSEARAAINALDGSDMNGREVRVKFSGDMVSGRKTSGILTTAPKKNMVFESPHKAYVGNLAWSVRPESLREYFSQFGTVVSARVLYDRKGGKNRVYGFVSFSSADELKVAVSKSGSEFHGRTMLVREITDRNSRDMEDCGI